VSDPQPEPVGDPRVRFAAERTLLAWVRTGLAMMGFGFVVARFGWFLREMAELPQRPSHSSNWSVVAGVALIALGVVVSLLAAREHRRFLRDFDGGKPYRPPAWSLGVVVAVVMAGLGILMAGYLVALSLESPEQVP
jgi:putative membrane protein